MLQFVKIFGIGGSTVAYYKLVKDCVWMEEYGRVDVYGIQGIDEVKGTEIVRISNIFTDFEKAECLVEKCNRLLLDPVHLYDVAEDELLK